MEKQISENAGIADSCLKQEKESEKPKRDKCGNLICKGCGAWLEPEPDEAYKPETIIMFGIKEECEGAERYICRVCEYSNEYVISKV